MRIAPASPSIPLLLLSLVPAASVVASGQETTTPGALTAVDAGGELVDLPLRHTSVSIEVSVFVARTTVEQVFVNPFDEPIEVVYTFPLSHEAAVDEFEMQSGDRVIRGEIHRREEARDIFEAAKAEGRQAALLEQQRPNVFTQSVANLLAAGEVRVRLRTVEVLPYDAGKYQLTFPLLVGPRYVPQHLLEVPTSSIDPLTDVENIDSPVLPEGLRSGHDVDIHVTLEAGVPLHGLESVSHAIEVEHDGDRRAEITLSPQDWIPNRDFILRWSVAADEPVVGLVTHRDGVEGYFALVVQPRAAVEVEDATPKEILFVLDTSGSMNGPPLELSKAFIRDALHALGSRDTFNLIQFSSGSSTFAEMPLDGTAENVRTALKWIDKLRSHGGTEMLGALERAVEPTENDARYRMIVFLTDGYIGNEAEILARTKQLPAGMRVFTVGIGSSVNHSLLDGMAELGGGAYTFIANDRDGSASLARYVEWLTRPYLTQLEIDWGALPVGEWVPEIPRDLFSGQNLTVIGRYYGAADGTVVLRGLLGGVPWQSEVPVTLPDEDSRHGALASVWARGRIQELLDQSPGETDDAIREEVIELALEHRLMSPYTSFVAVDYRVLNPGGVSKTCRQPVPLPHGTPFPDTELVETETELMERVRVLAMKPIIDVETAASVARFSDEFIADLPVLGRSYLNVLLLVPGVQDADSDGLANVHGSLARDLAVQISGVREVDPLAWQGIRGGIHPAFVEEVALVTAGAGVEFGRAQGGFANIVQKQGGNEHEGSFSIDAGSDALDGTGSQPVPVSYHTLRGGVLASGPIVRDRLWYRASLEGMDRGDPVDTGPMLVVAPHRSVSHSDSLVWQLSARNKLQLQGLRQREDAERLGVSSLVRPESTPRIDREDRMLSMKWTVPLSPRILIETILSRRGTGLTRTPAEGSVSNGCIDPVDDPLLVTTQCLDLVLGAQVGTAHQTFDDGRRRYGLEAVSTIYAGTKWGVTHQLKVGIELGDESYERAISREPDLVRVPDGDDAIVLARTSAVPSATMKAAAGNWALFFEDQLKPDQGLAFTLGLRLDSEWIDSEGVRPFDPRDELERFVTGAAGLSDDERAAFAADVFTGPADLQGFLEGVAAQVGEDHCCGDPVIDPDWITSPLARTPMRLDAVNLSPFFSVKWSPWDNGKTAFSFSFRRYFDRLLPAHALVESEQATADVIVHGAGSSPEFLVRPSIQLVDHGLRTPYQDEWSLGAERQLFAETSLSLGIVRRRFEDQIQLLDLNHVPGDDGAGGSDLYVQNPLWGDVTLVGNFGTATYEGLTLALVRRQYHAWEMKASYTFSEARGSAEAFDSLAGDERTLLENRSGLQSHDQRHVFELHGVVITRWGIRLGSSLAFESGLPYSTLEQRIVHDAVPPALTGLAVPVPAPRLTYATATRNESRNDPYFNVDLRVMKDSALSRGVNMRCRVDVLNALDDRSFRIEPGARAYGRLINGFADATYRSGRQYRVGLDIQF